MKNKKENKPRQKKYETKLKVNASFDEILVGMVSSPPKKLKTLPNNNTAQSNRKRHNK